MRLCAKAIPLRQIARRLCISLCAVQYWRARAGASKTHRADVQDLSCAPKLQARETASELQRAICHLRRSLATESDLGFIGPEAIAEAIAEALGEQFPGTTLPSTRTISRILQRHGLLDGHKRRRFKAPPTGWHLPAVALRRADMDVFDGIEDLPIEGVGLQQVLTAKSLHGPHVAAWITPQLTAAFTVECLRSHWGAHGLPGFAQFDNDTRFQGPHNRPNVIGSVIRFCLRVGVIPVFAPPREMGFQSDIESFNALWQQKVWERSHHTSTAALQQLSERFCAAYSRHRAARQEHAPARRSFPKQMPAAKLRGGTLIFIRRTSDKGTVRLLEQTYAVDALWTQRLVRAELDIRTRKWRIYRLRRKDPENQPLLKQCLLQGSLRLD